MSILIIIKFTAHLCNLGVRALATIKLPDYKLYKLDKGPPTKAKLEKEEAMKIFMQMHTIRNMENNLATMYKSKQVRGFCHLCVGQEACVLGVNLASRPQDTVITSYRVHGSAYLMNGNKVEGVLAELAGLRDGVSIGKGGSMHMYGKHLYGGQAIVGAQVPLGTGIAHACKYLKTNGVSFTIFGDGTANQGQVFESYNIANLWKLPVVYVVENNQYGMGTSISRSSSNTENYKRGDYLPGVWVDGQNVLSVREACKFGIQYAMEKGPIILDLDTYRYFGHSMSDPGKCYRSRDEVQKVRDERDPIKSFTKIILDSGFAKEADLKKIAKEIKKKVSDARKKVLKGKEPLLSDLYTHILVDYLNVPVRKKTVEENIEFLKIKK